MDVLGSTYATPSYVSKHSDNYPYQYSLALSASSSSSSVFSVDGPSSQCSISSASTTSVDVIWEGEIRESNGQRSACFSSEGAVRGVKPVPKFTDTAVPPELRQNPRRTGQCSGYASASAGGRHPPSLVRQCDRKINFVDNLVDSASQIVECIWPLSVVACRSDSALGGKGVLPLRTFIQETLRRSRTSYSTLQVALYYLIMIKAFVPKHDFTMEQPANGHSSRALQCGRRMFLAALILASKYLQDRNYSARAWSKISGLNTQEINQNELTFLSAVDWKLHIPEPVFQKWTDIVLKYTPPFPSGPDGSPCWKTIIPRLMPGLDSIDIELSSPKRSPLDLYEMNTPSPPPSTPERTGSSSSEQTPTNHIPLPLEPIPRAEPSHPPFPPVPRLNLLPTPQMTPQTSTVSTPAVSTGNRRRKGSICSAMAQIQSSCMARTAIDRCPLLSSINPTNREYFPTAARRSSLAHSTSSASSPESMVSDVSTRSSRSSSISSVASSTLAPNSQPPLAVQATRRCANLQLPGPMTLKDIRRSAKITTPSDERFFSADSFFPSPESICGPPTTDLLHISLNTPRPTSPSAINPSLVNPAAKEAAQSLCDLSQQTQMQSRHSSNFTTTLPQRRKRSRPSSSDLTNASLQENIRSLLASTSQQPVPSSDEEDGIILSDSRRADSFVLDLQNGDLLGETSSPAPMKVHNHGNSRKRACCGEEAAKVRRERIDLPAPGMWDGILQ